jgi:formylglycine-generating enzyme required for sulfatase activity
VPVAKGQRVARRLVVLIDRARPGEPLALLMARLAQALADEGVAVVTRHFDRDPRRALRPGAQPGDVLVLCSDGRGLLDARDGALRPWLAREVAQAWPLRVLLTPVPVASWGAAEDGLAGEGGFVVLPAVSWALPALARRVVSAQDGRAEAPLELPFVAGAPARWPGLLRGQALRWLSPTVPAEEDVAALLRQLRGLLGARGFGWLAACAAYPQVSLALAEHLATQWDDEPAGGGNADDARLREAQWLALAHLPWLRQGWMPDWLRRALLRELPAAQRERLGEALRALLRQDGAGALDMGRIATAYQRRWFTRLLGRGEPAGSPLRDVIYLGLLDGTIDKELALGLDAKTAERVRRKVEPAWRRPLVEGIGQVLAAGVFVWGVVIPYLRPAWVPGQTAVVAAKTPDMPAGTRFRDCKDDACPWMVVVPAGEFLMGSPADEPNRSSDEGPQHRVRVAKFAMARFEVTQGQWKALMGSNPSGFTDCVDNCPVENVSWDDAQAYVKKLSEKTGQQYRLPSEAEWEYAARAGTTTAYAFGATLSASQANFSESKIEKTVAVGSYVANDFGLSDMHGNVWEWVQDCWHDTHENSPINGESWETNCKEERRVLRGGGWSDNPSIARAANRDRNSPGLRDYGTGFRLARTLTP